MAVAMHRFQDVVGAFGKPVELGVQVGGDLGDQGVELVSQSDVSMWPISSLSAVSIS